MATIEILHLKPNKYHVYIYLLSVQLRALHLQLVLNDTSIYGNGL